LEGIPLALELAAARVRSLAVADINKRLNDRYKLLTGGDRTLQARQQTLRALVDWSYDLLEENEQVLLARLSVFAGGFGLEAAETICGAEPLDAMDVLDLITSLVEKSLLRVEEHDAGARYRMLETIREYAAEKLVLRDELATIRVAHCEYFLQVAQDGSHGMDGPDEAQWIRALELANDDMRAAMTRALADGGDAINAIRFEVRLMGFWLLRGYVTEGRNYVRASLAHPAVQASELAQGHALYVGAALADSQGLNAEAQKMLDECLAIRRKLDNPFDLAATLSTRSLVLLHSGHTEEARIDESEAVKIFREIEHRVGEAMALLHLGQIEVHAQNDADARAHLEEAIALAREIGYAEVEAECELTLGQLALYAGDVPGAVARFERSLEVCNESEDKRNEAVATWWLGRVKLREGEFGDARVRLTAALRAFHAFEMTPELIGCLEDFAELLAKAGAIETAVDLMGAAASLRERLALTRSPRAEGRWQWAIAHARERSGEALFQAAFARGRERTTEEAVACALDSPAVEPVAA
ncbi:MAG TPA: tetratricopeptide repeat protein, partial [Steroidobacteraceae bacterium]